MALSIIDRMTNEKLTRVLFMQKVILITGSTDGIGLETAKLLLEKGHHVIIHGRNDVKVQSVEKELSELELEK